MEGKTNIAATQDDEYQTTAWGLTEQGGKFAALKINRPKITELSEHQVNFEVLYSGICHSDIHVGTNEFKNCVYPFIPGHEILGRVLEVGSKVTKVKVGDNVGVGVFVDACLNCDMCRDGDENYCMNGMVGTYNGDKKYGRVGGNQTVKTQGGYCESHTVYDHFVMKIPDGLPLDKASPIMCAGITMFSPIKHWGGLDGKKMTIGVVGVGGLGTMGVKIAKAAGHDVVAISTSKNKEAAAKEKGATHFVVSTDPESMATMKGKVNLILATISADHDINHYMTLLAKKGTIVELGLVMKPHTIGPLGLMYQRHAVAGSMIGGIKETQECLDFCAKHQIWPDCETVLANKIDWCWEQLQTSNKDGVRYVIDIKASLADKSFLPAE